jgi:hypothetical protein
LLKCRVSQSEATDNGATHDFVEGLASNVLQELLLYQHAAAGVALLRARDKVDYDGCAVGNSRAGEYLSKRWEGRANVIT